MNDLALSVHIVQTNEALTSKLAHEGDGHSAVVVTLDELEEIDAQDFKYHNEVLAVRPVVDKRVKQLHTV